MCVFFFFQAEDGIRDATVTGVQTCALPISRSSASRCRKPPRSSRRSTPRSTPSPRCSSGSLATAAACCAGLRLAHGTLGEPEIVLRLEVHPELSRCLKEAREQDGRFWRHAALSVDDRVDALEWDLELLGQFGLRHLARL